jgi:hypothetical protein
MMVERILGQYNKALMLLAVLAAALWLFRKKILQACHKSSRPPANH